MSIKLSLKAFICPLVCGLTYLIYIFVYNLTTGVFVFQIPVDQFKPSDVEIQACFRHENIAELYGAVLWGETVHLFMEAGEGGSVLEKLESCGPMREFEIIWVTKHVLKGLDFLHSKKVIHHDIKRELRLAV